MTTNKEYKLKLLNESSASEDLFEDKTHLQIANTLYDVIQQGSSDGITIGLEGGWGSGKSTVVTILKHKLEFDTNTICFYFDAWAHEGDPLRRVFLEALIDQVGHDNKNLQEIKSRVSNRKKTSNITSSQTVTKLGKWLALAALFVPLGAAIISDTASKIDFQWKGALHWIFMLGFFCALAPFIVLVRNGWKLWREKKNLADMNNWMFLQGESERIVTQEVSEDEERSSIEFEQYFAEIVNVIFSNKTDAKLLIVVDNLDRVDADDSLKIWSTLQTFLQRKNPSSNSTSSFKKIWVLVPYDEDGLAKLWKHRSNGQKDSIDSNAGSSAHSSTSNKDCAKSFFDKCFQLRIEVPKLILTGWEKFCTENVNEALIGWDDNEKNDVVKVLKWTREGVDDIPTPREIKTFVNQVGLLRLHCDKDISTIAIAYFSVQKYMKFQTNKEIEGLLLSGNLPQKNHKPFFDEGVAAELCGILFGVPSDKGQQLLLEPKIEHAFNTKNIEEVKALSETHKNAFWTVLNLHLTHMVDFNKMARYSSTIWSGLWKTAPNNCREFICCLKATTDSLKSLEFPAQNEVETYVAIFSLLEEGKYDFEKKIWKDILQSLTEQMKKVEFDYQSGNMTLTALAECQKINIPKQYLLGAIPIENWMKWATSCLSEGNKSYSLVRPQKTIIKEISSKFVAGSPIPKGLHDLITYLTYGGENQWEPVVTAIQTYLEWNQGTPNGDVFSVEIFQILTTLTATGQKARKSVEPILKSGAFYNLTYNLSSQGAEKYAAFLFGECLPKELDTNQVAAVGNSAEGIQLIRSFWKTNNEKNAQFVWSELKERSDFKFIWDLAINAKNVLVGDVIKIAVNENSHNFFNCPDPLKSFEIALAITDSDNHFGNNLAKCFLEHGHIEKDILDNNKLDIIHFSQELNYVVENSGNVKVAEYLKNMFNMVTKEQWDEAFIKDSHLTLLAVTINGRSPELQLNDNHYESLLSYLQSWISNSVTPSDPQKQELPVLISMLKNDFQIQLKNRLAIYLIEAGFKGSFDAILTLIGHVNIEKLITNIEDKLQYTLEDFIRASDINSLKILDLVLSHKDSHAYTPAKHLAEVLKAPIKHFLETQGGSDTDVIERFASRFGVDLTEPQPNVEDTESVGTENANS